MFDTYFRSRWLVGGFPPRRTYGLPITGEAPALVTAPPGLDLFVYRAGRLRRVPFSAASFLGSDIVGPGAKLRALLEPLTAGPDPRESVARYFTRKLGRELYETLVGPLYAGLYGSDPADMRVGLSLRHVLDRARLARRSRFGRACCTRMLGESTFA